MHATPGECFHCGEPLAGRAPLHARVLDREVPVCCPGCRAAAELIAGLGLADFYRYRTAAAVTPPEARTEWLAYDDPQIAAALTRAEPAGRGIVVLIDGLTCAACSWLISRALLQTPGVVQASVNTATGRAHIVWDPARLPLSRVLAGIEALGYLPRPVAAGAAGPRAQDERRAILKRLAVAGLGMMQVMMFAVALYSGALLGGMDDAVRAYLRGVSLLVTTPVLLYGGWPFFVGAANALRARAVTMDVPVSLGLLLAYGASVFDTWRGTGEVYFDSVTMFIFFLTVARYVEMLARHRSNSVSDSLSRLLPVTAHRLDADGGGTVSDVTVQQLRCGDRILVRAGEVIPADGAILRGATRIDESMLTGESLPVARAAGDPVAAGTINVDAPVEMRLTAVGAATVLANIAALLDRAQAERPSVTRAADAQASRFLARVLGGALLVCIFWSAVDPGRAFAATLAVLVVACPCALSLATLVAVASANAALARRGVLVTHPDAIEGLAKADRVVFDKTGTLTRGLVSIGACRTFGAPDRDECLAIAAALEAASEHPIGRGFAVLRPGSAVAADARVVPGAGIEGLVNGTRYRIGTRAFVAAGAAAGAAASADGGEGEARVGRAANDDASVLLGTAGRVLAAFDLQDAPRPGSAAAVAALRRQGLALEILSGDAPAAVAGLARHCGIDEFSARQSPQDKLRRIRTLTGQGAFVAMVGDGINDAPVLGGSGVSIAMGHGSALAQASADLILVGDRLESLPEAFQVARRAQTIIRQNLVWAAGYNLTAMPLAALGWVPPWLAAIGMSLSSILVVLNSMRVMRVPAGTALAVAAAAERVGATALAPRSAA